MQERTSHVIAQSAVYRTIGLRPSEAHIYSVVNMSPSYFVVAKICLMVITCVEVDPRVTVDETDSCASHSLDEVVSLMSNEFKEVKDLLSSNSFQTADSSKQETASLLQCKCVFFIFAIFSVTTPTLPTSAARVIEGAYGAAPDRLDGFKGPTSKVKGKEGDKF